jgi:hypothetical protein
MQHQVFVEQIRLYLVSIYEIGVKKVIEIEYN